MLLIVHKLSTKQHCKMNKAYLQNYSALSPKKSTEINVGRCRLLYLNPLANRHIGWSWLLSILKTNFCSYLTKKNNLNPAFYNIWYGKSLHNKVVVLTKKSGKKCIFTLDIDFSISSNYPVTVPSMNKFRFLLWEFRKHN